MNLKSIGTLILAACLMLSSIICNSGNIELVDETSINIDRQSIPVVSNAEKFLNDLMLSPYWEVTKGRDGNYIASARNVYSSNGFNDFCRGEFLFSKHGSDKFDSDCNPIVMRKKSYFDFSIQIVFGSKTVAADESIYRDGNKARLGIYTYSFMKSNNGDALDGNAYSILVIPLNRQGLVVKLREQGKDNNRRQTAIELQRVFDEIRRISQLPAEYYVSKVYADYFKYEFEAVTQPEGFKRTKGMQDRDTFSGYLTYKKGDQYAGVNIRVLNDIYCKNRTCSRTDRNKAEYLGKPYFEGDKVYYQFSGTAVYLDEQFDNEYGTFTGNKSFKADIEIFNADNTVLYKSSGMFKGWQR